MNEEIMCDECESESPIILAYDGSVRGESCCNATYEKKRSEYEFRDFSVNKLNYGYIVTVGCHKFAVEDKKKLIKLVSDYIDNPNETESNWWKTKKI